MNLKTKQLFMRLGLRHAIKLYDEAEQAQNPALLEDYLKQYASVLLQSCMDKIEHYTEEAVIHENEKSVDDLKDLLDEVCHSDLDERTIRIVEGEIERAYQKIIASAIYQICIQHSNELLNFYETLTQKLDMPALDHVKQLESVRQWVEKAVESGDIPSAKQHYETFYVVWEGLPAHARQQLQSEWVFLNPKTLAVLSNARAFDFMLQLGRFQYPNRAAQRILPKLIAHPQIHEEEVAEFIKYACDAMDAEKHDFLSHAADYIEEALSRHEDKLAATILALCDSQGIPINNAYLLYVTAVEKEAFHTLRVMDKIQLLEEGFIFSFIESHIHSQVSANKIILDVKPIQTALENIPQHLMPIHFDADAHYQYIFNFNDPVLIYFMLTSADAKGFKAFVKRYKNKKQLKALRDVIEELYQSEFHQASPEQQRWLERIKSEPQYALHAFFHIDELSGGFFDFAFRA